MNRFRTWVDGSLMKRTVLSVLAMLAGSALFVGLLSFALVATTESLLPGGKSAPSAAEDTDVAVAAAGGNKAPSEALVKPNRQSDKQQEVVSGTDE